MSCVVGGSRVQYTVLGAPDVVSLCTRPCVDTAVRGCQALCADTEIEQAEVRLTLHQVRFNSLAGSPPRVQRLVRLPSNPSVTN